MDLIRVLPILGLLITFVDCSKILVLLPIASTSHKNVFIPVVEELASRGHHVTFFTPVKPTRKGSPNVKEVTLPQVLAPLMENMQKSLFDKDNSPGFIEEFGVMREVIANSCEHFFNDSTTKTLLKEGKQFDVAIVSEFFNDCALATSYLLAKHVIHFSSGPQMPWCPSQVPAPPSYVPNAMLGYNDRMSFFERLLNALSLVGVQVFYPIFIQPISQQLLTKYLPEAPSIDEAYKNIAFTIVNMDSIYHSPRPSLPNIVSIGAAHCRPAQPVPKEFTEFIESSGEEGVVMFGLGSVAKSSFLPTQTVNAFLSAFKRLKQKVIWKFEADLDNLPDNVKITKWMPQQDLLGHPKIRAFMTHGGLLSLEEALYHAVPIIGVPLFADQHGNVVRAKQLGIGESLDIKNITSDQVYDTITKVLNDRRYADNMKKYSRVLRDQPEKPLDRAVFWIEYVIRHDGARHLRSAGEELNFFQYFLLDVVAFIAVTATAAVGIVVLLIKLVLRKFCKCSKKLDSSKKKND